MTVRELVDRLHKHPNEDAELHIGPLDAPADSEVVMAEGDFALVILSDDAYNPKQESGVDHVQPRRLDTVS